MVFLAQMTSENWFCERSCYRASRLRSRARIAVRREKWPRCEGWSNRRATFSMRPHIKALLMVMDHNRREFYALRLGHVYLSAGGYLSSRAIGERWQRRFSLLFLLHFLCDRLRCLCRLDWLAHPKSVRAINGTGKILECGIIHHKTQSGSRGLMINPKYWLDFKNALEAHWNELQDRNHKDLPKNFFKRARRINLLRFRDK